MHLYVVFKIQTSERFYTPRRTTKIKQQYKRLFNLWLEQYGSPAALATCATDVLQTS